MGNDAPSPAAAAAYTPEDIYGAMRKADAAGDGEAVRALAAHLNGIQNGGQSLPSATQMNDATYRTQLHDMLAAPKIDRATVHNFVRTSGHVDTDPGLDKAIDFGTAHPGTDFTDIRTGSATNPPPETVGDRAYGLADSISSGLTAGLVHPITAAIDTILPTQGAHSVWDGSSIGDAYKFNRAREQTARDAFQQAHPTASMIGEVGGAILSPINKIAAPVEGASMVSNLLRVGASGATHGAVHGATNSRADTIAGVASDAAKDSLIAGGGGMALGAGLSAIGSTGSRLIGAASRVARGIPAPGAGANLIASRMAQDGIEPSDAVKLVQSAQTSGTPMMLADMGDNLRLLAGSVSRTPGPARTTAMSATLDRQMGQTGRVRDAINETVGPTTDTFAEHQRLIEDARTEAGPLYDQAYAAEPVSSPLLDRLLSTPAGKAALARAHTIAGNEMRNPTALGLMRDQNGDVVFRSPLASASDKSANYAGQFQPVQTGDEFAGLDVSRPITSAGNRTYMRGPMDITKTIRSWGGVADPGGDLASMGITNASRKGLPFGGNEQFLGPVINPNGISLNDAAVRLKEAGYFHEPPTDSDLLDALHQEHSGNSIYHPDDLHTVDQFHKTQDDRFYVEEAAQRGSPMVDRVGQRASQADIEGNRAPLPTPETVPAYPTQTLDYVKRGLDDIIQAAPRDPRGKPIMDEYLRSVQGVLKRFTGETDKLNPAYAAAREAYAGPASAASAMNEGRAALTKSANEINQRLGNMTETERQQYALGLRSAIADAIDKAPDGADVARRVIGSPAKRAVLSRVFGGTGEVDNLVARLQNESATTRTYSAVHGGPATANRIAEDSATNADLGTVQQGLDFIDAAKKGKVATLGYLLDKGRDALRYGAGQVGQRTREDAAALLFSSDPNDFLHSQELSNSQRLLLAARNGGRRGLIAGQRLGVAGSASR